MKLCALSLSEKVWRVLNAASRRAGLYDWKLPSNNGTFYFWGPKNNEYCVEGERENDVLKFWLYAKRFDLRLFRRHLGRSLGNVNETSVDDFSRQRAERGNVLLADYARRPVPCYVKDIRGGLVWLTDSRYDFLGSMLAFRAAADLGAQPFLRIYEQSAVGGGNPTMMLTTCPLKEMRIAPILQPTLEYVLDKKHLR